VKSTENQEVDSTSYIVIVVALGRNACNNRDNKQEESRGERAPLGASESVSVVNGTKTAVACSNILGPETICKNEFLQEEE
jgi:hypothetical protein